MEILSLWNRFSTLHSQFFNQYLRVRISIFMENKILVWYVSWYVLTTGERKLLNYSGGKEDINSPQFCSFQLFFSVKAPKRAVLRAKQMDKCLFIMLPLGYLLSFCIHPGSRLQILSCFYDSNALGWSVVDLYWSYQEWKLINSDATQVSLEEVPSQASLWCFSQS